MAEYVAISCGVSPDMVTAVSPMPKSANHEPVEDAAGGGGLSVESSCGAAPVENAPRR
jgi:hypothetical protein